jgi:putative transposase
LKFEQDHIYHIFNQGNNHQKIFLCDEDYLIFLRMVRKLIQPHTPIMAWCLMPNHFHLMVYAEKNSCMMMKQGGLEIELLTNGIRKLLSGYARIFNSRYKRMGSLFRQKTKADKISDAEVVLQGQYTANQYCAILYNYIHQSPVRYKLVAKPNDWVYSSSLDFSGLRNGTLCSKALVQQYCDFAEIHQNEWTPVEIEMSKFLNGDNG